MMGTSTDFQAIQFNLAGGTATHVHARNIMGLPFAV